MSDLISRSELLRYMENTELSQFIDEINKGNDNYNSTPLYDYVKEMPTAYSVDEVVEELEKVKHEIASEDYCRSINDKEKCDGRNCFECCAEYLIEIVKQGGVSDDVCEWEKGSSGYVGYPAYYSKCCTTKSNGLEMQTHIIADWKYCPYCGKKIKVVD